MPVLIVWVRWAVVMGQVDLSCPFLLLPSCKEGKPHLPELHFSYLVLVQPTTNYRQLFDVKLRCRRVELVSMYFTLNFETIVDYSFMLFPSGINPEVLLR